MQATVPKDVPKAVEKEHKKGAAAALGIAKAVRPCPPPPLNSLSHGFSPFFFFLRGGGGSATSRLYVQSHFPFPLASFPLSQVFFLLIFSQIIVDASL